MSAVRIDPGVSVVLGAVWGDEGKGKLVDFLAQDGDIVCRCNVSMQLILDIASPLRLQHFNGAYITYMHTY